MENRARADQRKVWVLTLEDDPDQMSLVGVFGSPQDAYHYLREDYLGEEKAGQIDWSVSPYNPECWTGYLPDRGGDEHYLLVREQVLEDHRSRSRFARPAPRWRTS